MSLDDNHLAFLRRDKMNKEAHREIFDELIRLEAMLDKNAKSGNMSILEHTLLDNELKNMFNRLTIWKT